MRLYLSKRVYKSKIRPDWNINYNIIQLKENNKVVYTKNLNPIYDLGLFLEELRLTYDFD
jgi:hypothetical protein